MGAHIPTAGSSSGVLRCWEHSTIDMNGCPTTRALLDNRLEGLSASFWTRAQSSYPRLDVKLGLAPLLFFLGSLDCAYEYTPSPSGGVGTSVTGYWCFFVYSRGFLSCGSVCSHPASGRSGVSPLRRVDVVPIKRGEERGMQPKNEPIRQEAAAMGHSPPDPKEGIRRGARATEEQRRQQILRHGGKPPPESFAGAALANFV